MKYAYIENSIVTNIILWDGETDYNPGELVTLIQSDLAQINDKYEGGVFKYFNGENWITRE